jgi:hypothetical protein
MHICPYCNHSMKFNLTYVNGSPKVFWSCPHCKYDTGRPILTYNTISVKDYTSLSMGEIVNGTSGYMRSMRTAI